MNRDIIRLSIGFPRHARPIAIAGQRCLPLTLPVLTLRSRDSGNGDKRDAVNGRK
jgi:hypothetical protein